MNELKNKLRSVFEEIQYESEDLIAGLIEEATDSPVEERLNALRVVSSHYITRELKKASNDLTTFDTTTEIDAYLDHLQSRFKDFFVSIKDQEELVLEGQDITEFIDQLKLESDDWVYKLTQKSKELAHQVSDKLQLEEGKQKASETWHQVKDKSTEVYEEVKEKSSDAWHQVKDKIDHYKDEGLEVVEESKEALEDVAQELAETVDEVVDASEVGN